MTERAEALPTVGRVLAFALLIVVCVVATTSLFAPLAARVISSTGQPLKLDVFPNLVGVYVATAIMLRSIDRRPWSAVDLDVAAAAPKKLALGLAAGTAIISAVILVLFLAHWLVFRRTAPDVSWLSAATRTTIVLIPAALAEEVMCRGYLFTVVREAVGVPAAAVLTSVLFGVLHLMNPDATLESVLVVVTAGICLAYVRVLLRSLYAAWMVHFAWNWVMAVPIHASVSGIRFEAPGYYADAVGPAWISGGSWGPEGGIVAALGLMAALGYLYARHRREES